MKSKAEALADVREKRAKLQETLAETRARLSMAQLAEDATSFVDPDLTLLGRIRTGVKQNRLLSLAVLAGAGWLVGSPRRSNGEPRNMRRTDTATTGKLKKENKNDSGQNNGNEWTDSGSRESTGIQEPEFKPKREQGGRREKGVLEPVNFGAEDSHAEDRGEAQRRGRLDSFNGGPQQESQRQEER